MADTQFLKAPPGFTPEARARFERDGFVTIENAIPEADVERYLAAIERVTSRDPNYDPAKFYDRDNVVELDPVFAEIIDHPRHVGIFYDFFGELLKLHLSQFFCRPPGGEHNKWHYDGPRAVPYTTFSPTLPLCMKVAYWLTDLPEPGMGNMVLMPGSHRQPYFDHYDTWESVPGEHIVCARKGTMTIVHSSIWHRVEPNRSTVTRKNLFYAYCPSFVTPQDRYQSNPAWLATLTRERRIIMRSYAYPYDNSKPPAEDFPLYLDRETGLDHDLGMYKEHVILSRRKRKVLHEKPREA